MKLLKSPLTLILSLSLTVLACAEDKVSYADKNDDTPALSMEPELQPYYDEYVREAALAGVPVADENLQSFQGLMWTDRISKQAGDTGVLGHCRRKNDVRYVELMRPNAERKVGRTSVDDVTLRVMVYHELGHCLHDFSGHTSGGASIMNATLQPARYVDLSGLIQDHFKMLKKHMDEEAQTAATNP